MRPSFFLALTLLLSSPALHANEDTRVGTVLDRQGTALVRAVGRDRWTPIGPRSILMPGDQVRTPTRGANAVEIRLAGKGRLVMGPGTLVEIRDADSVRLLRGDIETKAVKTLDLPNLSAEVTGTQIFRSDGKTTQKLSSPPRWLTGYRSSTTDEWMGSLIAKVDGRNVPLHVGYHKVTVDIRDQIARTTIEQSFVNSTKATLEGVFYFPLPADASISSFGMWIGDELVEADIVEKQRARAIYEDILKKRKDPGLLEWSGGNLFKARVFPIFPHSEKRIRIQYTQVLPLEGSTIRYRYALRSELLTAHPLRQLEIKVRVSSSVPITSFTSSSHQVRARKTEHAASAEFDAEDYSPKRDFELRIGLDRTNALSVVPHRRDDDGYFMLLLAPPTANDGKWKRDLMPETDPLDLIIVADTSGSMDSAARAAQAQLIQALLALVGSKDTFRLMTCDVTAQWLDANALPVTETNSARALDWLEKRASLGWTDLDLAFSEVRKTATKNSVIIYVGDGISTTGDADPVAMAERIRGIKLNGTAHAIYTSSTYEQGVLEAIASIGGGSVRNGADDPVGAAYALLAEAAQPAVKDLKVTFEGLRTARVYPETLPNLAAGKQQVVLGRFLPTGSDQTGKVTITGTLDGKPVRYSTTLSIKANEAGNSFLPRLWARRHLDALLAQGRSPEIKKEIIAFSEEFGIMTPYTSYLVLESDAQREEYGVTRRVRMRDGERFFAEGRDKASTELLQQQMKLAKTWRLRLRKAMLREIATLGRHLHLGAAFPEATINLIGMAIGGGGGPRRGLAGGESFDDSFVGSRAVPAAKNMEELFDAGDDKEEAEENFEEEDLDGSRSPATPPMREERSSSKKMRKSRRGFSAGRSGFRAPNGGLYDSRARRENQFSPAVRALLFPALPTPPVKNPEWIVNPKWPVSVVELLRSLDRRAALRNRTGGIRIVHKGGSRHAANGHATTNELAEGLYGIDGWFVRTRHDHSTVLDRWLAQDRLGVLDVGLRLGRDRDATALDRKTWPFPIADSSFSDLAIAYRTYSAEIKDDVVILRAPGQNRYETHLRFDASKRVLTEMVTFVRGKKNATTRWSKFVEIAGSWWALRIERFDAEDRLLHEITRTIESLDAATFKKALTDATAGHENAIMLSQKAPTVKEAKQAVLDKRARFADHYVLTLHFAASQQWDRVFENWDRAEALVTGKPGALWLRAELMSQGRRGAETKKLLHALADVTSKNNSSPAQGAVAHHVIGVARRIFQVNEMLALFETLRPALTKTDYLRMRAQSLRSAGQPDRAIEIFAALAAARPFDVRDVNAYIAALKQSWRVEEALLLAKDSIDRGKWLRTELDQLYVAWTNLLWQRRDVAELDVVLRRWIETKPKAETAYRRYVSNLVFLDREEQADAWATKQLGGKPGPAVGAAIQYALGYGWNYRTIRMEEKWWKPLGEVALRLMRGTDEDWNLGSRVFHNGAFMATDSGVALRAHALADFTAHGAIEKLPLNRMARFLSVLPWDRKSVEDSVWRSATNRMKARWTAKKEEPIAMHVMTMLDARGASQEAIEFLRTRKKTPTIASELMRRLYTVAWTPAIEAELFVLLKALEPEGAEKTSRMNRAGIAVRALMDQLEAMRYKARLGPKKDLEKLKRAERRLRTRTARVEARKALSEALVLERTRADQWTAPWLALERLSLMAQTATGDVNGETRELFGTAKDRVLRERCAYVLAYIATRRKAPTELADQVVAFLKAQTGEKIDWQTHTFRLMIALSRNDQLQATLKEWITPTKAESRWRIALAYLQAEGGALENAVSEMQAVARADELDATNYDALSNWLLVLDRTEERERALEQRYRVMPEQKLSQLAWNAYYQVRNNRSGKPPKEFDPETLRALRVLFSKASHPANHMYVARSLYGTLKDFRILECLPYGVTGHTPQGVYPFLRQVTSVIAQVHEEATCDAFIARIVELQASAKTDLDRRALLLLLSLAERRASEVLNAPGPHARNGVRAMAQALTGEWLPGERRLMASWLASLGKIPHEAFAKVQCEQLAELYKLEEVGTLDRLNIALDVARTEWIYGRQQDAIDFITVAIDEYQQVAPERSTDTRTALSQLVNWLNARKLHRVAETRLVAAIASATTRAQRMWLQHQLFTVYNHAAGSDGSLSFGRGQALYDGARKRMEKAMWNDGADQLRTTLGAFCSLHQRARKSVSTTGADFETFAKERLPELLSLAGGDRNSLVQQVASTLHELRGARSALELLVVQIETEPRWLAKTGRDGWQNYGWWMARWRAEAGDLGSLAPRLLKIVTRELESDLTLMRGVRSSMYHVHAKVFWKAKAADFRAVALKVIELNPDSPARLLHCARYLWNSLRQYEHAIRALESADGRGTLRRDGRWQLAIWLREREQWKRAVIQLDKLLVDRPDQFEYVRAHIRALYESGRKHDARARLDATEKRLKELKRWNEGTIASLADLAGTCKFHARAVRYYEEVIPLHQRTTRNRGVGRGTLSRYYAKASASYLALGQPDKAVDAASAAVVSWGRTHGNRAGAIQALLNVLARLKDLDGYVARYEARVTKTGLDAPLIRKGIGAAYLGKHNGTKAVPHLLAARELQPNDTDIHKRLLAAYDVLGDADQAIAALMQSIRMAPLNLDLYADLGARLEKRGDSHADRARAERAWTTLVEVLPNEAASHRRLAEYRQSKNDHKAAVRQWRQVVRVRTHEPDGWLKLAAAQAAAGDTDSAKQTLRRLLTTKWANASVHKKAEALLRTLD